ncbi:MAG: rod shape-determining protein MreC [Proteobacteria bacterium]|nr:rod shape-determining protein MreC [Pseudomonadota bacterium]
MLSKKMVIVVVGIMLLFFNMTILSVTSKRGVSAPSGMEKVIIPIVAPFQKAVAHSIRFVKGVWEDYFALVNVSKENRELKIALNLSNEKKNRYREMELFNSRLREFLKFKNQTNSDVLAAEVISKDSSAWFKTIMIDKGLLDGVEKGLPVVVPEGIAGQVIDVADRYAKVLLIIDRNSAVDGLVQRTRARGVIKGESENTCLFQYALRKEDVKARDIIVSSGLDGVYPKGLLLGEVSEVVRRNSGIFQEVKVTPFVDFEKLEEVLVVLAPNREPM